MSSQSHNSAGRARELLFDIGEARFNFGLRADPQEARPAGGIGHADQRAERTVHFHVHAVGHGVEEMRERLADIAGKTHCGERRRGIDKLRFRAHHEHRQAFLHRCLYVSGEHQAHGFAASPHEEGRQQAALRRAITSQTRARRVQMLDVARQLRVKKSGGVVASCIDNAELRQRHEHAGVEDGVEGR